MSEESASKPSDKCPHDKDPNECIECNPIYFGVRKPKSKWRKKKNG